MKKKMSLKKTIILIICLICILLFECFIINSVVLNRMDNNNNNLDIDNGSDISDELENYINSTDISNNDFNIYEDKELGIKFKYPKEYTKIIKENDSSNELKKILIYDPLTESKVNVAIEKLNTQSYELENYEKSTIESLKQKYGLNDDEIKIDDKNIKMGDGQAFKIYYNYQGVSIYECTTLIDSTKYVLTYSSKTDIFNKIIGDKIYESFELIKEVSNLESSKENPIELNVWGKASKYIVNSNEGKYKDINVMVTHIIRGEEAKEIVNKNIVDNNLYSIIKEPEATEEWVVVEYKADFENISIPMQGISPTVELNIIGKGKYDAIKYNSSSYYPLTYNISSTDYVQNIIATNTVAFILPVECSNYILKFGSYNNTQMYVQGR